MGDSFVLGEAIVFQAVALDEEISTEDLEIVWLSDKDGELGTGLVDSSGEVNFSYSDLSADTHTIQFKVKDELESSCSDSIVISIGTPPLLSLTSPTDGDIVTEGELVQFVGTVQDDEDLPSSLAITWESDIDGEFSTQSANSNGELALNTTSLSLGLHSITITAMDSNGFSDSELISLRVNALPSAPQVSLYPDPAGTSDELIAMASGSIDPEGNNVTYTYTWFQNGSATSYTGTNIPSSATNKGETWTVQATPNDGYQDGMYGEAAIIIQNTAPSISAVALTPNNPDTNDTVVCSGIATDADGDVLSESYLWTNETTAVMIGSSASITLSPLAVSPGDSISCSYTVDDGSDTFSQTVIGGVVNTDPIIDSVSIVPSSPYLGDTLNCLGMVTDEDLETTTDTYLWKNQSTGDTLSTVESIELTSNNASPNDVIACTFTTTDPSGGTATTTTTTTVGNLPPSIDYLSFDLGNVSIGDTLTCLSSESDPEGDLPTTTYEWENLTTGSAIGSGASITITSSMATGLDEISCTATTTDNYGASDTESISIFLDPTEPEFIAEASISPNTGITTSSSVSCTGVATDPDGSVVTLTYEWSVGSTVLGTTQSLTLSPTTTQPTDVLTCTITATDTSGEQATSDTSVMIGNGSPVLSGEMISPSVGIDTSSSLTCSVTVTDPDLESLTPTFTWTNGTANLGSGATITLDPTIAQPSDSIVCTADVTDGYGSSDSVSVAVVVDNTAPIISSVGISPTTAYNDTIVTCSVVASDADNQSLTTTYTWMNSTTGATLGSTASLVLDNTIANRNDVILCSVEVSDPSGDTALSSTTISLDNRAPSAPTVTLSPTTVYIDSTVTCTPSGSVDLDGDIISYMYEWSVNGSVLSSETTDTLSNAFAADDMINCTITPTDGLLNGSTGSSSVTITNRIPSVDSVTLTPDPLYTDNTITATATASDLDGDILSVSYDWMVNGNSIQSGPDNTLDSGMFVRNDTITVSVTANDGNDTSSAVTASLTCNNTAPTAATVIISPTSPVELLDDVTCSIDTAATDIDSDSITYDFTWMVNGILFTGTTTDTATSSTIAASITVAGDIFECTVTPTDGTTTGPSASTNVTIDSDWDGQRVFTTCGQSSQNGPSQSDCDGQYTNTNLLNEVTVSNGIQYWIVPSDGTYRIEAYGAQGGSINGYSGGNGASMIGEFSLSEGDIIQILVGQRGMGAGDGAGGGGGTFVVYDGGNSEADILVIAGGGGGGTSYSNFNGGGGTTSTTGQTSNVISGCGGTGAYGGSSGSGGGSGCAAGGGGFYGNGDTGAHSAEGGYSFINGGTGGYAGQGSSYNTDGGFGGGGAGSYSNGYGGGGGGYSGGGGGSWDGSTTGYGGGGASYNNGANQNNTGSANAGEGTVKIDKI